MMRKPSASDFTLNPGDTIGVAAPAGPFDRELFNKGRAVLEGMGFQVQADPRITERRGFLAGDDQQRVDVLHALFENDDISAIVCARGGYGSLRLLPLLDDFLIRQNPKPFVGFSDITALLNVLALRCNTPVIHGPVVTSLSYAGAETLAGLERILSGEAIVISALDPSVITPGRAAGPLFGGNLTTLNHLLATEFMPDLSGCILLLEDVNEAPYRIDRMLCQMRMAGCFDTVAGIALGHFKNCGTPEEIRGVFVAHFETLRIPVLGGLPIGHGDVNIALPLGVPATIDTANATLCVAGETTAPS